MPTYVYRCPAHGETETDYPIGEAPISVECCERAAMRVLGVGIHIGADALPNKRHRVRDVERTERRWAADLPAFKRMVDAGLEPHSTEGAAAAEAKLGERGADQFALDHEARLDRASRAQVEDSLGGTA